MTERVQLAPLATLLTRSNETVDIRPDQQYRQVTVKLWGQGVVLRNEVPGAAIAAPRRFVIHTNQFILSRIDARHGALGLVPASLDGAVVSNDFPSFNINTERVLPAYLGWMAKTSEFIDLCRAASEGTTNRVRLQEDRFLAIRIPLPSPEEQRRIVARIEAIAEKAENAKRICKQISDDIKTVVESEARNLIQKSSSNVTKLQNWLDYSRDGVQTGPFGAQLSANDFIESGIPVITIGNVHFEGLDIKKLKYISKKKSGHLSRFTVQEGDILFARMGTVGRCCVVPEYAQGWVINYHIIRVALNKTMAYPKYIHWLIRASSDVEDYLNKKIRGATRQGVNSSIVSDLPCRIPPIEEQRRIVAYLDALQAKVDEMKHIQSKTQTELDALMPAVLDRAFRGDL